ncbi:MAG: group II intron reverse transcriptase/maturase [Bacillota bacterium]
MTKQKKETIEEIKIKKTDLRYNEYYNTQEVFDKLYDKSKEGKEFKDLMSIITSRKNILLAYRKIKNNQGSKTSGVNSTTIEDIGQWDIDKLIEYVKKRLNNYQPHPVKRVMISKEYGKKRPLGIPTIEDRIIQECIKQVLEPICEAKFHNHSYGFRANRSTKHAIARSMHLINRNQLYYTVDIDIKGFFDNVSHAKLLKQLWTLGIRDKNLISIISKLLKAEIKGEGVPDKGTPQGGIVSPLLSNIVLNEFDWWISNQFATFETEHKYSSRNSRITALKKSNLKEIYLVRYADDIKVFCRDYETASRIKVAIIKWLKGRLNLEVNKRKTKITNLKRSYTEFLGIKIKAKKKGNKYVSKSIISQKVKSKIAYKLKQQIKEIKENPKEKEVNKLNSMILGVQNYYSMATDVNLDFNEIAFTVNRTLENRLRALFCERSYKSRTFEKYYGRYNYKKHIIAGIKIFPIGGVTTSPPMNFKQETCNYTVEGRKRIHQELKRVRPQRLKELIRDPVKNQSVEYNDNRISRYCGQNACCYITGLPLIIDEMECHHKKPKHMGGNDNYNNLILVDKDIHKLIHATKQEIINNYYNRIKVYLDEKALSKLNKFRSKLGNDGIEVA